MSLHGTEEIDVEAPDRYIAEAMARELADRDYLPGWTLIAMPPGGSCGAVTIHTGGNK